MNRRRLKEWVKRGEMTAREALGILKNEGVDERNRTFRWLKQRVQD